MFLRKDIWKNPGHSMWCSNKLWNSVACIWNGRHSPVHMTLKKTHMCLCMKSNTRLKANYIRNFTTVNRHLCFKNLTWSKLSKPRCLKSSHICTEKVFSTMFLQIQNTILSTIRSHFKHSKKSVVEHCGNLFLATWIKFTEFPGLLMDLLRSPTCAHLLLLNQV